jgi:linoleoyl-CoA desaturase
VPIVFAMGTSLTKVRFDAADHLQQDLKARVDAYFNYAGVPRTANAGQWAKAAFFVGGTAALFAVLVSGALPALAALPVAALLGVFMAATGFNVGHDAIHGAFSSRSWVNALLSRTFDVCGASSFTWSTAHNFVHHTYTNVPGVDHDLDPGPFMLFSARPNPPAIYRLQHVYAFALYALTHVVWVFKKDFQQIAAPDPRSGKRAPLGRVVDVILGKVVHLALFVGLPIGVSGYAPWQVLVGYAVALGMTGLTLAVVFQLAHVVEGTTFPVAGADGRIGDTWAAHQLKTTANFAPHNWFWNFFTGGLNHQVEHHLMYKIAHCHYPALAPIVRDVAVKHGVPYHDFPTFSAALAAHVRTMKRFGHGEQLPAPAPLTALEPEPLPAE